MESSEARRSQRKLHPLGFPDHAIWGSELSPFALKLRALCEFAGIEYAWLPSDGSRLRNATEPLLDTQFVPPSCRNVYDRQSPEPAKDWGTPVILGM